MFRNRPGILTLILECLKQSISSFTSFSGFLNLVSNDTLILVTSHTFFRVKNII